MTFNNFNHKRTTVTRIGKRNFIGRILNYAGSFEDDLLPMPVRLSRRYEKWGGGGWFQSDWVNAENLVRL